MEHQSRFGLSEDMKHSVLSAGDSASLFAAWAHAWASKITTGSSIGLVSFGALTINELAVIFGMLLGLASYLTRLHFDRKEDKRRAERHAREFGADTEEGGRE